MKKAPPFFFPAVFIMLFLGIFYFTVTNMAGIYIASDLGGSHLTSVYPMVFYGLGNSLAIPLSKYLVERIGAPKVAIASLLIYSLFSLFCTLAPTYPIFNCYRFGLGLAAGPFFFLSKRWIDEYASEEKKKVFTTLMILMFSIVPVLGACFGAVLAYEVHWRWIFHFNKPISLFLIFYFWRTFAKLGHPKLKKIPFDLWGYVSYCLAFGSLVTAATLSQELDWYRSDIFMMLISISIPSLLFFLYWEWHHPSPIVDLRLFCNPALAFTLLNLAILFATYFGMIILIALWLQIYANYTPLWISVVIGSMGLAGFVGYAFFYFEFHRFDPRISLGIAIVFFIISCTYSSHFDVNIDIAHLAIARSLAGFGLILFLIPLFRMALTCCAKQEIDRVYILLQAVRTLSSSLGAGLYVILWQRRQVFFYSRLGSELNPYSQLARAYYKRATEIFHLTKEQATAQFQVYLEQQSTSLALNDTFGFMGCVLGMLLLVLIASFFYQKIHKVIVDTKSKDL